MNLARANRCCVSPGGAVMYVGELNPPPMGVARTAAVADAGPNSPTMIAKRSVRLNPRREAYSAPQAY